jgi:hypothetical protein
MAQQSKKSGKGEKNDDRRCRKAWKKNPGNPASRCNGKSVDGITIEPKTQATLDRRVKTANEKAKRAAKRVRTVKADTAA